MTPLRSFLSRCNPLTKLTISLLWFFEVGLIARPAWMALIALQAVFSLLFLHKTTWLTLCKIFAVSLLSGLSYGTIYALALRPELVQHSPILFSSGHLVIYQQTLVAAQTMTLRAGTMILVSLWLLTTTSWPNLCAALTQHIRIPYKLTTSMTIAYQSIPWIKMRYRQIRLAQRLRGFSSKSILFSPKMFFRLALPLFAHLVRRAERTALAMDARAFGMHKTRTYLHSFSFSGVDVLLGLAVLCTHIGTFVLLSKF